MIEKAITIKSERSNEIFTIYFERTAMHPWTVKTNSDLYPESEDDQHSSLESAMAVVAEHIVKTQY